MNDRTIKGISTELQCQNEFIKRGYMVSVPICQSCRYDFIVDINGKLIRVQAKYSRKSKTGLSLSTRSIHLSANGSVKHKYTQDDADYMCTVFDDLCYLIPISEIENRNSITLSMTNTWSNAHHLMIAKDYTIDRQIEKLVAADYSNEQRKYKIQQLSKDGELIAEYNHVSESDICKDNIENQAHISECINGKRKSAYGYKWKRVERNTK